MAHIKVMILPRLVAVPRFFPAFWLIQGPSKQGRLTCSRNARSRYQTRCPVP